MRDRIAIIDINTKKFKAISYKQYDENNILQIVVLEDGIIKGLSNYITTVRFQLPSGKIYKINGAIENNTIKVVLTSAILNEYGKVIVEVELANNTQVITTFSMYLNVEKSINKELSQDPDNIPDVNDKLHTHENKEILDKITQEMINSILEFEELLELDIYATKDYVQSEIEKIDINTDNIDLSNYYTKEEVDEKFENIDVNTDNINLSNYYTKEEVDKKIENIDINTDDIDLSNYAKKEDLDAKADKTELFSKDYNDLINKPNIPSLEGYATESYVKNEITNAQLGGGDNEVDLSNYVTKDDLNGKADITDIPTKVSQLENDSKYLTSIPEEYITETELNNKGYLTEHQDISHLATKNELFSGSYNDLTDKPNIPSLDGYATESYVKNEIANAQLGGEDSNIDLSGYATKDELNAKASIEDIPTKVSQLENDSKFITSIPSEYVTDEELDNKGYLTKHQDISHLALKSELHSHTNKSILDNITQNNINEWNNKSEFDGNYNSLTNKPNIPNIEGLASEVYVDNAIDNIKLPNNLSDLNNDVGYITNIPNEYITESELNNKGYLTEHQDISGKADKTELFSKDYNDLINKPSIPSLDGYVSKDDMSNYATKSDLSTLVTKETNKSLVDNTLIDKLEDLENYDDSLVREEINSINSQLEDITKDEFNLSQIYCNDTNCSGGCGKIKGDGVHDDTSGFEYAFQNITQTKIKIPQGIYKITSKIEINRVINVEGNNIGYSGATLNFYNTSGFDVKVDFVSFKNITLICDSKLSTDSLNIDERVFGYTGFNFVYSDKNTSSASVLEDVTINNFNVGISAFDSDSQIWSGAYREFRNCNIANCDIGYFSSKTTHDKFIGGHINYSWLHPIYVTSDDIESNIDFIGTTLDGNRDKTTSIYCEGENTSIRIENSYLEYLNINNTKGGKVLINNSFVNPNVKMSGQGIININNVWGSYSSKYYFNFKKDRTWGTDVEVGNETNNSCKIFSNIGSSYKDLTGFIPIKSDLKINDLKCIKLSFDYNINSGLNVSGFGLKTGFCYVEKDTNKINYINTSSIIDNEINKYDFTSKKGHFEVICNLDKIADSRDVLLSELRYVLKFNNTVNGEGSMDFSSENLDIDISNLSLSLYSNNELSNLNEIVYSSDLTKIENKVFNKFSDVIPTNSSVSITLPNNGYEAFLCILSVIQYNNVGIGVDVVALVYSSEQLGLWTEIVRKTRSDNYNLTVSMENTTLTITNNNNTDAAYVLKNCLIN